MWALVAADGPSSSAPAVQWMAAGTHGVGRRGSYVIVDHKSVSRVHATLLLTPGCPDGLLTDRSRFGVELDGRTLTQGLPVPIQPGMKLRLGASPDVLTWCFHPYVFLSSTSDDEAFTAQLRQVAAQLGATVVEDAHSKNVSHLIVPDDVGVVPLAHASTLGAVLQGAPLVTMAWLRAVAARKTAAEPLPPSARYEIAAAVRVEDGRTCRLPESGKAARLQFLQKTGVDRVALNLERLEPDRRPFWKWVTDGLLPGAWWTLDSLHGPAFATVTRRMAEPLFLDEQELVASLVACEWLPRTTTLQRSPLPDSASPALPNFKRFRKQSLSSGAKS